MTQSVCLALPCYTGTVHLGTFHSVITDIGILNEQSIPVTIHEESGNAMIAHSRNMFLSHFLGTACTDLVFIDSDVQWEAGAILKLLRHPVDLVAAIYPKRCDPLGFNCRYMDKPELWSDKNGLLEVEGVPMGLTRITRACIEKMIAHFPDKRFAAKDAPKGFAHALFDNIHEGDAYFGEDYSFCRRFRQAGGQVFVDPEIAMGHVGNKLWWGKFGDWLKNRPNAITASEPSKSMIDVEDLKAALK